MINNINDRFSVRKTDKFDDFFFDGLIADWVVQSRIHDSQEIVNKVREEVRNVLSKLSIMQAQDKVLLTKLENELRDIIENS